MIKVCARDSVRGGLIAARSQYLLHVCSSVAELDMEHEKERGCSGEEEAQDQCRAD
jgi:hypothetical protein